MYFSVFFDKTLYSSPLMVVTDQEYSKHYFIEGERVCTKIGGGFWGTAPFMPDGTPVDMLYGTLPEFTYNLSVMTGRHIECTGYAGQWDISPSFAHLLNKTNMPEYNQYFYHSDHASTGLSTGLGSASFVTDATGYVDQHIQYLPFGELFISQRNSTFDSRYKFTAKELDNETNYTYFGARYYDSDISIWLSIDPLSDKYPSLSPYAYCANNPVVLVDPDGRNFNKNHQLGCTAEGRVIGWIRDPKTYQPSWGVYETRYTRTDGSAFSSKFSKGSNGIIKVDQPRPRGGSVQSKRYGGLQ